MEKVFEPEGVNASLKISKFKDKIFVIKYGGSIMDNKNAQNAFIEDITFLTNLGIKIVIVHGGGPEISRWLNKTGTKTSFVQGLRVTDESTMEIVEMVLSGNVNKKLSSNLCRNGLNAIGISGRDNNLLRAKKKYVYDKGTKLDLGFVGEVVNVNKKFLLNLLNNNYIPVISPIGFDSSGKTYNINADYAAGFISGVLNAEKFIILTDINGVYKDISDPSTLIPSLTKDEINFLIDTKIISGGMIPKLQCCIDAIEKGAKNVHLVNGGINHSLLINIIKENGTKIIDSKGVKECLKAV